MKMPILLLADDRINVPKETDPHYVLLSKSHHVEVARTGDEIWQHLSNTRFDCILLDIMFGERGQHVPKGIYEYEVGLYFLERITDGSFPENKETAVIVMTSTANIETIRRIKRMNIRWLLRKPFEMPLLLEVVALVLQGSRQPCLSVHSATGGFRRESMLSEEKARNVCTHLCALHLLSVVALFKRHSVAGRTFWIYLGSCPQAQTGKRKEVNSDELSDLCQELLESDCLALYRGRDDANTEAFSQLCNVLETRDLKEVGVIRLRIVRDIDEYRLVLGLAGDVAGGVLPVLTRPKLLEIRQFASVLMDRGMYQAWMESNRVTLARVDETGSRRALGTVSRQVLDYLFSWQKAEALHDSSDPFYKVLDKVWSTCIDMETGLDILPPSPAADSGEPEHPMKRGFDDLPEPLKGNAAHLAMIRAACWNLAKNSQSLLEMRGIVESILREVGPEPTDPAGEEETVSEPTAEQ